ncbi:MAG TPA: acetyl-CoA carboxylase, carboxyltransferase subunit beta [Defluviitaleaceae bacterium]|nr:acetyl-CoA carboxylase carboxyltransferase subunit beta [Candidatus Epulonipiscium sp.]HOQ16596.1 acetyl-CoA carboxylase, carboxyltransferase subunit beta [Defluviitaleaceae bacterium]HPT76036.1 acetyl-CoA carboxylase, carboxyltransferase subunit beta [Defluviitaleaceae bacterium]HQD49550.1 acetyl-CoA carboxylase, carboxyltransferase subunit beta [Defluviitaleaceae bacterium]
MIKGLFKKTKYVTTSVPSQEKAPTPNIPDGMWVKCNSCEQIIYKKDIEENNRLCPNCGFHFRMSAKERIKLIVDEGTFIELDKDLTTLNPLDFPQYEEKIRQQEEKSGIKEAVITGTGRIYGEEAVIAVMDSFFLMGSMGSVVGEKITRAVEEATERRLPLIIFCASGGARMQEGIFSLMQMAKTAGAIARHDEAGLLYISVLTDPTTGGVTASFAMLADIIVAEPGALIGFAGSRVIEQTIKQKLPEGFQRAEFLLEHGFIDMIIRRQDLKKSLGKLLCLHKEVK